MKSAAVHFIKSYKEEERVSHRLHGLTQINTRNRDSDEMTLNHTNEASILQIYFWVNLCDFGANKKLR